VTELVQLKLSLPPDLAAYVHQQAARTDRTPSGIIRHWIAEAQRREPPPEGPRTWGKELPGVAANPQAVAEAQERVAKLREEQAKIRRKQLHTFGTTASEDERFNELTGEIGITEQRIRLAEQMMRPTSGGPNDVV
jgi:hypothetical protein